MADARSYCSVAALLVLAVLGVACSTTDENAAERPSTTRTDNPATTAPQQCAEGAGDPLSVPDTLERLRVADFSADVVSDPVCTERLVAEISNIHFTGPHADESQHDEVRASEGHLRCEVADRPIVIRGRRYDRATVLSRSGDEVEVIVQNVLCLLMADPEVLQARVAPLRDALGRTP